MLFLLYIIWAVRIRITKQLQVEPEEEIASAVSESESEPESHQKPTQRRKTKRSRKDHLSSLPEQLEDKVSNRTLISHMPSVHAVERRTQRFISPQRSFSFGPPLKLFSALKLTVYGGPRVRAFT